MNCAVCVVGEAFRDFHGIPLVRLDFLLLVDGHGCRGKDDAGNVVALEFFVEGKAEASSFVAAEEFTRIFIILPDLLQIFQDVLVIRFHLDGGEAHVVFHGVTRKGVICGMDIHPNVDYTFHM